MEFPLVELLSDNKKSRSKWIVIFTPLGKAIGMRTHWATLASILFLAATLSALAGAGDAEKLVGAWTSTQTEGKAIEFSKDGKVKMQEKVGKKTVTASGTYTLKEKALTLTIVPPGKEKG